MKNTLTFSSLLTICQLPRPNAIAPGRYNHHLEAFPFKHKETIKLKKITFN
jgi:hypothetical protein